MTKTGADKDVILDRSWSIRDHRHRVSEEMVATSPKSPHWAVLIVASWLSTASVQAAQPLFDAHLHYNAEDAAELAPETIIAGLQANRVLAAIVTSRPPEQVLQLHAQAPRLILPMLGVYRTPADKATWMDDVGLPERVEQALAEGPWRAVGELHLFAEDRRSPVFLRIVELVTAQGLPLLLHCDPAVIDTLFEQVPEATVIWAHAGAYPYPPLLRDYLQRYPGLHIDLSVRDQRLAPDGQLDPQWELLLLEHSERFMVGVDTYWTQRWHDFADVVGEIRHWLNQLPDEVSGAIAYRNAARLFQARTKGPRGADLRRRRSQGLMIARPIHRDCASSRGSWIPLRCIQAKASVLPRLLDFASLHPGYRLRAPSPR